MRTSTALKPPVSDTSQSARKKAKTASNGTRPSRPRVSKSPPKKVSFVLLFPAGAHWKRLQGKLSLLPDLPLDILFEIFEHLSPADILHLARTAQDFRRILMHRSAIGVWKSSLRQAIGLPERPKEMSEPAWVNLLYSPYCHNCLNQKVPGPKVDWLLRIRLCGKCVHETINIPLNDRLRLYRDVAKDIAGCIPSTVYHMSGREYCLAEEENTFLSELHAAGEDTATFVCSRREAVAARRKHAEQCREWADSLAQDRVNDLAKIKRKRREDISERLEELGFAEELKYVERLERSDLKVLPALLMLRDHPALKAHTPLTKGGWKRMEAGLTAYMSTVRAHRIAAHRLGIIQLRESVAVSSWAHFRLQYSAEMLLPSGIDILSWEKVKAIIHLPSKIPTCRQDAVLASDSMAGFISAWEGERTRELASRTVGLRPLSGAWSHMDSLRLATCVFTCEDTDTLHHTYPHMQPKFASHPSMWFPEFLHHPCNTVTSRCNEDLARSALFVAPQLSWCQRKEWSSDALRFDEKVSRVVKRLLTASGKDQEVTTTREMDDTDPWFLCLNCSYGFKFAEQRPHTVMPWRTAVQHCMIVHWGTSITWEMLPEEAADEARKLSAARSDSLSTGNWRCAHCRYSSYEKDERTDMKKHLDRLWPTFIESCFRSHNFSGHMTQLTQCLTEIFMSP
ncbi:hypothetical protein C8R47DRAFT_1040061 [Mycena vitilis]|nr:hypothetical protein C8R47DRAFT_1040061 [Mycena vitilis]